MIIGSYTVVVSAFSTAMTGPFALTAASDIPTFALVEVSIFANNEGVTYF